jgi:hypothetical protein
LEAAEIKGCLKLGECGVEVNAFLLNLVTKKLHLLLETLNLILFQHDVMITFLFESLTNLFHCCLDPLVEVSDLVEEECLKELHLSLDVLEVTFIDLI